MMNTRGAFRITLLAALISLGSIGCGESDSNMTQEEIQFVSHLDQARFFQRQGELKASTLEARSAQELQPQRHEPYFIMIDNLLMAGDAINAERQLRLLKEGQVSSPDNQALLNRATLAMARSHLLQRQFDTGLEDLNALKNPDRTQQLEAETLRGDILLAADKLDDAKAAYLAARQIDTQALLPVIGLSRVAMAANDRPTADSLLMEAEQINPTDPELWLWKAQQAHQAGNYEQAESAYMRALEDIGQYDIMTFRKYQTISALIDVLRAQQKAAEAFVYEEILAKSAPGTIKSNFSAAQQAFAAGNLDKASRHLEEIIKQAPGHEQSLLMLGMIRFQQGQVKEAEKLLAPFAQRNDLGAATKLLAATKLRLQQPEEARALLEKLDDQQSDPGVLALVAIASFASGDAETGQSYMDKALALAPQNAALRQRYGQLLQANGNLPAATRQFEEAVKLSPESADNHIALITLYIQQNKAELAHAHIREWLKTSPNDVAAQVTYGDFLLQQGDLSGARKQYEQALKAAPDDFRTHLAMGNMLIKEEKIPLAVEQFQQAVTLDPENRIALKGLMSAAASSDDLRGKSIAFLQDLITKKDDAVSPRLVLLEIALVEGKHENADTLADQAIARASEAADTQTFIASIYGNTASQMQRQNRTDEAEKIVTAGLKHFPEHEGLALLSAALQFQHGNESEAVEALRNVKMKHPDSPRAYMVEAEYRMSKSQFEQAAELYRLATTKADSIPEIPLQQANALQKSGQKSKALELIEASTKQFPDHVPTQLALALAYQADNKNEAATKIYENLLTRLPDSPLVLNNLAWLYKEQGNPKALELAEKAYKASPDSAAIIDTYAWILLQQGRKEESLPLLERAHSLTPDAKDIALHLAEAYKANGSDDKAKLILEKM